MALKKKGCAVLAAQPFSLKFVSILRAIRAGSLLWLRRCREIVAAERRGGQAGAVVQVHQWVVRPPHPHADRFLDRRAADDDFVTLNFGVGIDELLILTGDREAIQLAAAAAGNKAAVGVLERQRDLVPLDLLLVILGARIGNLLAVGQRERPGPIARRPGPSTSDECPPRRRNQ